MRRFTLGLTLLAAMGTVSFADIKVDKVSGNARLFYSTDDSEDFFDKESSLGDVSLSLDIAAQIMLYSGQLRYHRCLYAGSGEHSGQRYMDQSWS